MMKIIFYTGRSLLWRHRCELVPLICLFGKKKNQSITSAVYHWGTKKYAEL